jgi:hypothetical protein
MCTECSLNIYEIFTLQVIRELLGVGKYVVVVEHDLSVLDYLSDFICCLYGKPGAYGAQLKTGFGSGSRSGSRSGSGCVGPGLGMGPVVWVRV